MRLVIQRVTRAAVRVGEELVSEIGPGAVVLVGVGREDDDAAVERLADRLVALRYFRDEDGRTNRAIGEAGGEYLVVSQFTLYADTSRGRRPGFTWAADPDDAARLVARFVDRLKASGTRVATGRFGAEMEVELVNDGPFTLVLDTAQA